MPKINRLNPIHAERFFVDEMQSIRTSAKELLRAPIDEISIDNDYKKKALLYTVYCAQTEGERTQAIELVYRFFDIFVEEDSLAKARKKDHTTAIHLLQAVHDVALLDAFETKDWQFALNVHTLGARTSSCSHLIFNKAVYEILPTVPGDHSLFHAVWGKRNKDGFFQCVNPRETYLEALNIALDKPLYLAPEKSPDLAGPMMAWLRAHTNHTPLGFSSTYAAEKIFPGVANTLSDVAEQTLFLAIAAKKVWDNYRAYLLTNEPLCPQEIELFANLCNKQITIILEDGQTSKTYGPIRGEKLIILDTGREQYTRIEQMKVNS